MAKDVITARIDKLTMKEYRRATRQIVARTVIISVIVGEVAAIIACAILKSPVILAAVFPLAALALSLLITSVSTKNHYTRSIAYLSGITYTFDAKGMTVSDGKHSEKCRWSSVQRVDMDGSCLYIYPNRKSVNAVPRRCLEKGDGDRIVALYQAAMPGKKK